MSGFLNNFIEFVQAYGVVGLAVISFAESSFFPIPPDVLLIPMSFMNRKLALFYSLVTTVSSVLGGIFGHIIGRKLGKPLLTKLFKEDKINKVEGYFKKYGGWSIAIAGFTPIPYKIFTISAGVFNVRMTTLIGASILGRGARFFIEGLFILVLGDAAKYYIQNYFEILTIGITVLCIIFYFIWKKLKASGKIKSMGIVAYFKRKYNEFDSFRFKYKKYDEAATYFFISIFLSFTSLFALLEFIEDYLSKDNWKIDVNIMSFISNIRNTTLDNIFKIITTTGNTLSVVIIVLISALILIRIKKKKEALFFSMNTMGLWIFNEVLKQIFKRPRPSGLKLVEASGYSFPSGHAMIFMGISILLAYYILTCLKKKGLAIFISTLILVYSVLVGLSRVYVGVHYISDVFAGWFAGILWSSSSIAIYKFLKYKKS